MTYAAHMTIHMMPRTQAAKTRLDSKVAAQRDVDLKTDIDDHLKRWNEAPCSLEEARWYNENEPHTTARDAAEEIMCERY